MIRLQDMTPSVYYEQSRDFQFIGRLFDVVLNSVKTNSQLLYNLPINDFTDDQLIDLLALTLGFKPKHNYNIKQLRAICSVLSEILRKKGTKQAIEIVANTLLHAEGIKNNILVLIKDGALEISMPIELYDIVLFNDLLSYILPAGVSCNIKRVYEITADDGIDARVEVRSSTTKNTADANETSKIVQEVYNKDYANSVIGVHQNNSKPGLIMDSYIYRQNQTNREIENEEATVKHE